MCPEGWIRYNVDGGGTVEIVFNSGGWSAGMDCAAIQVRCPSNILAEVVQSSIEYNMPTGFHGKTDRRRQFTITLRDMKQSTVRGARPDNVAIAGDTSAAVPHKTSENSNNGLCESGA